MDRISIEDIIKNKLKGHKEQIDKDELWASLGLEQEPKKKRGAWWLWSLLLLLIASIGGYLLSTQVQPSTLEEIVDIKVKQLESQEASISQPFEEVIETVTEGSQSIDKNKQSKNTENATKSDTKQTSTESNSIVENEQGTSKVIDQENGQLSDVANIKMLTEKTGSASHLTDQRIPQEAAATLLTSKKSEVAEKAEKPTINHSINSIGTGTHARDTEICIGLASTSLAVNNEQIPQMLSPLATTPSSIPLLQKGKVGLWHAYAEYGTISRSLESIDRPSAALVGLRNESETPLDYFALGLRYEHPLSTKLSIFGGVEYMQLNEKTIYAESDSTSIPADVTTEYTDINGVTTTSSAAGTGTAINAKVWSYHNQIRMVNIPIGLKYQWAFNRLRLGAETSVAARLVSNFSGEVLANDGSVLSNPDYLNTGFGLSWSVGLSASYVLNDKVSIGIAPVYRRHLSNFASSTSGMRQTYETIGGRLSFVTKF